MSKRRIQHDSRFPRPGLILPGDRLWTPDSSLRKPSPVARNFLADAKCSGGCCGLPVCGHSGTCADSHTHYYTGTVNNDIVATISGMDDEDCVSGECPDFNYAFTVSRLAGWFYWLGEADYPCPPDGADSTGSALAVNVNCNDGPQITGSLMNIAYYDSGHPDNSNITRIIETYVWIHAITAKLTPGTDYTLDFSALYSYVKCANASEFLACGFDPPVQCDPQDSSMSVNFSAA